MIQILSCESCHQPFALPEGVSPDASLSCPQCNHVVSLSSILNSDVPSWNVVEGSAAANAPSDVAVPAEEAAVTTEEDLELADVEETKKDSKSQVNWSEFKPITHDQFERNKRRSRSPIWSILQVVLGGVASVPIALLILWHLLDKDVAGAGPMVAEYVPWIVPEKFHPIKAGDLDSEFRTEQADLGFRKFDDVMPLDADGAPNANSRDRQNDDGTPMASADSAMERDSASMPASENYVPKSASSTRKGGEELAAPQTEQSGSTNIFGLIRECENHLDLWRTESQESVATGDKTRLRQLANDLYQDFLQLTDVIGELPQGNPVLRSVRDAMQPIGKEVKKQSSVQNLVAQGSKHWAQLKSGEGKHSLAIVIEIAQATENEQQWVLVPADLPQLDFIDQVTIPTYLAPSLISGQRLFLLGEVDRNSSGAPNQAVFRACYLHAL